MRQGINSKELRHLNYYYDERLRKSLGYGKRGLSCRAVIYKFPARGLWGEPHPSFVLCLLTKVRRTFEGPERHGSAFMTHW